VDGVLAFEPSSPWSTAADILDPPGRDLWVPFPKQQLATELADTTDETLFGGSAGPGKTEWGLEYVIDQMERVPGNRGGVFRRVFPSLSRTIIPRLKMKLLGSGRAKYNGQEHTFTFPNTSVLECASLQYEDTVTDHQGTEYGIIFFEEITEFMQSQYEYMLGRLRRPATIPAGIEVFPHAINTTNPGGRGHTWVKRRFVRPRMEDLPEGEVFPGPYQQWRPRQVDGVDDPGHPPGTRVFIPATHEDNPALLKNDPGYLARLRANTNRGLRLAMEKGDWDAIDAVEGALWTHEDLDGGRVPRVPDVIRRVVAVDPSDGNEEGEGDEYGVSVCAKGLNGHGYVEGTDGWRMPVRKMARATINLYHAVHADAIVIEKNHGGKWMLEVFRQVDPTVNIVVVWASHGKLTRAEPVAALFTKDEESEFEDRYRAHLVGFHEQFEEEATSYTGPPDPSPNRMDAVVWGLSELMLGEVQVNDDDSSYQDTRGRGRR
jgi:hypothetical protein